MSGNFAHSIARFFHADWERKHQIEPTCHAAVCYITIGRPPILSPDFLSCYPSHKRRALLDTQELTNKGRLHTTDDDSSGTRGSAIAVIYKTQ